MDVFHRLSRASFFSAIVLLPVWLLFEALPREDDPPFWQQSHSSPWPLLARSAVALFALFSLIIACFRFRPIVRRAVPIEDAAWTALLQDLSRQLGLSHPPGLLIYPEPLTPRSLGLIHPRIVLPCDCHSWTLSHRRVVLLYELAHIVRRDLAVQRLARSAAAVRRWLQPRSWDMLRLLWYGNSVTRPPVIAPALPAPQQLRIDGGAERLKLTRQVPPVYPDAAKAAGIEGAVFFEMVLSKGGEPLNIRLLSSPDDDLTKSALEAVQQWRYEPTLLDGNPVEIVTDVIVNYSLAR